MPRGRLQYILIPIAALIPILPLILHGCSCGHDFDFHLLSWLEAAQQFRHGNLHPTWALTPAYGAGEPRFIFYPPLSWTIGAILGLIFPWTWTPILYTWLTLTAAGLALHRLARAFTSQTAALIAASFYIVNPYTLFTAYERTAYAELLAAVWIPILLHSILRPNNQGGVTIPRIAIPIALLWLTNAPAAVMSTYALALLTTIRLATTPSTTPEIDRSTNPGAPPFPVSPERVGYRSRQRTTPATRLQLATTVLIGTALGLGIAAFYILPAAYERRYVLINMALVPDLRVQDNFLFHHSANPVHNDVLHTASIIAVLLLSLTAIALLAAFLNPSQPHRDEHKNPTSLKTSLITLTIATALLLTPLTKFIWLHAPELAFLQFPWRILAILAAVLSLTIALVLRTIHIKPAITAAIALIIATAFTIPAYSLFNQPCDEEDNVTARVALFHSNLGTEPTDEYTPITADNDALSHTNPPYWLSPNPDAPPPPNSQPGPAPHSLTIDSPIRQFLILDLRNYPAWHIYRNNTLTPHNNRNDGLTAIQILPGHSQIQITHATLPDQTIGAILSLISLTILIAITRYHSQPTTNI